MFAQKLKQLRIEQGFSQKELAEKLKISRSALSLYETDRRNPDYNILAKIATYFNVTVDYLLGQTNSRLSNEDNQQSPNVSIKEKPSAYELDIAQKAKALSPDSQKKAIEYIEMLKQLDAVKSTENVVDLTKQG